MEILCRQEDRVVESSARIGRHVRECQAQVQFGSGEILFEEDFLRKSKNGSLVSRITFPNEDFRRSLKPVQFVEHAAAGIDHEPNTQRCIFLLKERYVL